MQPHALLTRFVSRQLVIYGPHLPVVPKKIPKLANANYDLVVGARRKLL